MEKSFIKCPSCGSEIEITDALKEQVRQEMATEMSKKIEEATEKAEKEALVNAKNSVQGELTRLKSSEEVLKKTLAESNEREKDLLKNEQSLQQKIDNVDLEIAREVNRQTAEIRSSSDQKLNLKEQANKLLINSLNEKIEELDKKVKQGSQQSQGEVFEEELASMLRSKFPFDTISEVKKGVRGADVLQIVNNNLGEPIGSILYESKNTKDFSTKCIPKLKNDLIDAKADLGVILSAILPEEINHIGEIEGVWITDYLSLIGLASALRSQLMAVAQQKRNERGKTDKAVILYDYFISNGFKQRINLIIEPFIKMQSGILQEKRAMAKLWKIRERHIEQVIENLACFTGDVIAITGKNLELPSFNLEPLEKGLEVENE